MRLDNLESKPNKQLMGPNTHRMPDQRHTTMSSTAPASALSRARSLRKPTKSETPSSGERNASPSRLPVKPPGQTRLTRSATTSAATKGSRPLSGVFARMTSAAARQREKDSPAPETSPPGRLARASSIRQPSTSTRTAGSVTAAGVRPTTSSGVPTSRRAVSGASTADTGPGPGPGPGIRHMRAKSSVTSLSSATTLRPPSQTSTTSSSTTVTDRSRPPISSVTRRPLSIAGPPSSTGTPHRRIPSTSKTPFTPSSPKAPPPPPKHQPSNLNKALPLPPSHSTTTTNTHPHPRPRTNTNPPTSISTTTTHPPTTIPSTTKPAFTTHQQHFTPTKSPHHPKPLTASYLAPPSPSKQPANIALSAETARLQTELLQLHLLHRDARAVGDAWRGSARAKLEGRFDAVRGAEGEVVGLEGAGEEGRGVGALLGWVRENRNGGLLEERVVMLDAVVGGLWGVGEPGGRYGRVVGVFEGWVGRVEGVMLRREEQQRRTGDQEEGVDDGELFIPELPTPWREECAALLRRLDDWRRKLRELGDAPPLPLPPSPEGEIQHTEASSSLARILAGCRALVHGMLAELEMMEQIEREAVAAEMRWVKEMNRGMDEGTPPRAGAIWRAL